MLSLLIKNFQSIKEFKYDFDNKFYTISGKSNIGKSAIRRAVTAVLENNLPKDFIRIGSKKCEIRVDEIVRIRFGKENKYKIGDKVYDKVGNQSFLYLPDSYKSFSYQDGEENLLAVPQYKPFFLVNENKQTQTKILKAIFGVDKLSEVVRLMKRDQTSLTRKINELTDRINLAENELKQKKQKLDILENIVGKEEEIEQLNQLVSISEIKNKIAFKIDNLDRIINNLDELILLKEYLEPQSVIVIFDSKIKHTNKLISIHKELISKLREINLLKELIDNNQSLVDINVKINSLYKRKQIVNKQESFSFELGSIVSYIDSLKSLSVQEKYQEKLKKSISLYQSLIRLIAYNKLNKVKNSLDNNISLIEKQLEEINKKIKILNICPCCGQPIKESNNE